ncbi:MAG: lipid-A-disaccharide synthase, partial [Cyclobacteriaceae bacterium]|nr:lipid-A-disaccharide synthase [Cyclobacteriaceae bacterium]
MKYYVIAGERSGDLHGGNLLHAIKGKDKKAVFQGIGGDNMQNAGCKITLHYEKMSFMGFWEVLKNLS